MSKGNGLHHIAIATGDMKAQIEFFSDVLGMRLLGLFWMHGVPGAWHAFLELGEAKFSLVMIPGNDAQDTVIGQTHPGNNLNTSAPGTMQHIAFNVDTTADLLEMRDRIRSRGIPVFGPMTHGFCQSIYFAGPENLSLEFATNADTPYEMTDDGAWIDPEVIALAGISESDLQRYRSPEAFVAPETPVEQPAFDPDKPHLLYPEKVYQRMLSMSDEDMARAAGVEHPPGRKLTPAE